MAATYWKKLVRRTLENNPKIILSQEELTTQIHEYTLKLEREIKKLNHEQYDAFSIAKFTFHRSKAFSLINGKFVKEKASLKTKEAFQNLKKILDDKYERNRKKWNIPKKR